MNKDDIADILDVVEKLAEKNILVTISSGIKDVVNGYGLRFVPHIKVVKVTQECVKGCGEHNQNYRGEIHNGNCKWRQKENTLFFGFAEKEDVLLILSNYI